MPFTFTVIPDWVFDQVLTYTLNNTFKDNQENVKDSLATEHTFSTGAHDFDPVARFIAGDTVASTGAIGGTDVMRGGNVSNPSGGVEAAFDGAHSDFQIRKAPATTGIYEIELPTDQSWTVEYLTLSIMNHKANAVPRTVWLLERVSSTKWRIYFYHITNDALVNAWWHFTIFISADA